MACHYRRLFAFICTSCITGAVAITNGSNVNFIGNVSFEGNAANNTGGKRKIEDAPSANRQQPWLKYKPLFEKFFYAADISQHYEHIGSYFIYVLSSHLFWTSGLSTYQPESHRRKVTQDSSSPSFCFACRIFSREEDSAVPFSLIDCEVELFVLAK